jgi:hypothetical protein
MTHEEQGRPEALCILACILSVCGCLSVLAYDFFATILWVGDFPLEVQLEPRAGRQIVKVWTETLSDSQWAKEVPVEVLCADLRFKPVDRLDGSSFVVLVRCGGNQSGLGRERSYGEHRLLILKVDFADGESLFKVVEMPKGRGRRAVSVTLP